jgi:prepilin-type N-terminal cleavage/methylation domain-containing protein
MNASLAIPSGRRAGFTLVEILVATSLMAFALAGILGLVVQTLRTYYYDRDRIAINRDIRTFTQDMATDAAYANYFMVFPSFAQADRSTGSGSTAADNNVQDGLSGDFLVLVSQTIDATTGKAAITGLVGYYRAGTTTTDGPVRRCAVTVPNVDPTTLGTAPVSSLLNTYMPATGINSNAVVIQLAQGLANGNLFYNFQNRSIMVRGQIQENGGNRNAVNTYNFTVSPRG